MPLIRALLDCVVRYKFTYVCMYVCMYVCNIYTYILIAESGNIRLAVTLGRQQPERLVHSNFLQPLLVAMVTKILQLNTKLAIIWFAGP